MPSTAPYERMQRQPPHVVQARMAELRQRRLHSALMACYETPDYGTLEASVDLGRVRVRVPPESPVTVRPMTDEERQRYGPPVQRTRNLMREAARRARALKAEEQEQEQDG